MTGSVRDDGRLSEPTVRLDGHRGLVALALAQKGVFCLDQARQLGLGARALQKQVACGRLFRQYKAVYSFVPAPLLTREGRYMAAVLACGPGAVISHRSAAVLHDIRPSSRTRIEVTVPRRVYHEHAGIQIHRSTTLAAADITTVDGIPCTTLARTLFDLSGVLAKRQLERALERAEMLERLDVRAVKSQLARHPQQPGTARLRELIAGPLQPPTESELEERFLMLWRSTGLPEPRRQMSVDPGDGGPPVRPDFMWPDQRVIVEVDGRRAHGTARAFEYDRRRDQRLRLAGWTVIRITWRQLADSPAEVIGTVSAVLAAAERERERGGAGARS